MKETERVRWRCRRGMLELDIVLGRFVERHYGELDEAGRAAFDALLEMPDTALWDMITGKSSAESRGPQQPEMISVLERIRAA